MTDDSTAMATVRVCAGSIKVSVLPRRIGASSGSLVLRWNDIRQCQSIDTRKIGWLHGIHPTVGGSVIDVVVPSFVAWIQTLVDDKSHSVDTWCSHLPSPTTRATDLIGDGVYLHRHRTP